MPRHIVSTTAVSERATLVSGTWYTPSATQPAFVTIKLSATGIGASEDADFLISLRDASDVVVTGYPLRAAVIRNAAAVDVFDFYFPLSIIVPAGFDYNVTNNSTGASAVTMDAIEALM